MVHCSSVDIRRSLHVHQQASSVSPKKLPTARNMKNLLLVAVILQLVITIRQINGKYQFGDIIEFPRICLSKTFMPIYNHYAIYVGNLERDIGQGDNDIFHRTGPDLKRNCRFDKLAAVRAGANDKKMNFLDGIKGFKVGTTEEMIKRIAKTLKNCERYQLTSNNCEHLATYVRYGIKKSLQRGSLSQYFIMMSHEARKLLAEVQKNMREEADCEPK